MGVSSHISNVTSFRNVVALGIHCEDCLSDSFVGNFSESEISESMVYGMVYLKY